MDSDDEDVIFENSVLHQALLDLGVTDVKTESRPQLKNNVQGSDCVDKMADNFSVDNRVRALCGVHTSLLAQIFYGQKFLEEMHHYHRHRTKKWLISLCLLSEDDQIFLQSYADEEPPRRDPSECLGIYSISFCSLLMATLVSVNLLCPMEALTSVVALAITSLPEMLSWLSEFTDIISRVFLNVMWMVVIAVPLVTMKKITYQKILYQVQKQVTCIEDLARKATELLLLEKKCLRLIKGCELVARGFTLVNQHHVASRSSHNQAISTSDQLCRGLREVMLTENITLMQELKMWVAKMMRGVPMVCAESDYNTLEELKENESSIDPYAASGAAGNSDRGLEMMHEGGIISPCVLSRSVELLGVYLSGFIRRLALCFYQPNLRDKSINPYLATQECTEKSRIAVTRAETLLRQAYTFYRAVHKPHEKKTIKNMQQQQSGHTGRSEIYNFYICINSLDLHLQSLLHITRELTVSLEERVDKDLSRQAGIDQTGTGKPDTAIESDKDLWRDILKRIKSGLDSCKGCYDESMRHVQQRKDSDKTANSPVKETSHGASELQQTRTIWIPAEDPVIVDQVFEAVTDSMDETDFQETRHHHNAQDRARLLEEKEAITRFRQELHTVVGNRAVLQKIREDRALARARGETDIDQKTDLEVPFVSVSGSSTDDSQNVEAGSGLPVNTEHVAAVGEPSSLAGELNKVVKSDIVFSVYDGDRPDPNLLSMGGQSQESKLQNESILLQDTKQYNPTDQIPSEELSSDSLVVCTSAVPQSLFYKYDINGCLQGGLTGVFSQNIGKSDCSNGSQVMVPESVCLNADTFCELDSTRNSHHTGRCVHSSLVSGEGAEESPTLYADSTISENSEACGCADQSSIHHGGVQNFSNHKSDTFQDNFIDAGDSVFKFPTKMNPTPAQSVPYTSEMAFPKSIAFLAACRAKALPTSYLQEERFGDESSDSENDSIEGL